MLNFSGVWGMLRCFGFPANATFLTFAIEGKMGPVWDVSPRRKMAAPGRGGSDEGGADVAPVCNYLLRVKMVAMGPALLLLLLLGLASEVSEAVAVPMPGGRYDVRVDAPNVAKAIRTAVKAFNRDSNDAYRSEVSNVISAQEQVVEGMMYHLTLELRTTVCRKRSASRNCPFHKNPRYAKVSDLCTGGPGRVGCGSCPHRHWNMVGIHESAGMPTGNSFNTGLLFSPRRR
ncbi:uncharacterized protein LOC132383989 isoform X1 [Hypanus sabinus]|uniref:uncharacterized protein LOC132383989 isoform X1 n=1 Tax=Hypanus sabinus TaxID=79690 RepID=UPI0028C5067E|nr:uncharacterized protein LOC132383989 isoform X1 [Hypanus sabinus]